VTRIDPRGTAARRFLRERVSDDVEANEPFAPDAESGDVDATYLGWEVARCAIGLSPDDRRGLAALAAACIVSNRTGSTRLPLVGPTFVATLTSAGGPDAVDSARRLIQKFRSQQGDPVDAVIGRRGERKPLIVDGDWLYSERMLELEARFCDRIRQRVGRKADAHQARSVERATKAVSSEALTDEQTEAVRQALQRPLTLISGGPGTGKTTAVVALVRAVAWLGAPPLDAVAIAAPTGRAAQRLSDAIAIGLAARAANDITESALRAIPPTPTTLHRLLGWSPRTGRFARHENDPLAHRLVIVDEASMVDLAMMDRLVRSLRGDARLVLLGDTDQLPSVEAGAVFRDLCASLGSARLTKNLRVAREPSAQQIVSAARAVNAGTIDGPLARAITTRHSLDQLTFEGVEHLDAAWSAVGDDFLERWWRARMTEESFRRGSSRTYRVRSGFFEDEDGVELKALFAHHARAQILCVTRGRGLDTSSEAINDRLVERLLGRSFSPARAAGQRAPNVAPGAPCVVQRNDYARGRFNGDPGVVVRAQVDGVRGPRLMAAFARGSRFEALPLDGATDLAPAFAMTVHKAQGSESDHVTLILPDRDVPLLTRELVYTAMTRARRSVLIVGPSYLLARAVERTTARFTGVREMLELRSMC
jgi:exodeoxyribonuclease V alpha subunit